MHLIKKLFSWCFFLFLLLFLTALILVLIAFLILYFFSIDLPDHKKLTHYSPSIITRVFSSDGKMIAEYAIEKRIFLPIQYIPKKVKNAFLAAEDKNFYKHFGVDVTGMIRAVIINILNTGKSKRPVGASTITQQVAKIFLTGNEVSYKRKIKEAILAFRLEHSLGKDKILELYLNQLYLGNASYGVAIASKRYFNKSIEDLSIAEASYLAALAKGANNYHPIRNKDRAIKRRNWVIDKQLSAGFITATEAYDAKNEDLVTIVSKDANPDLQNSYFVEEVRRSLIKTFSYDNLYNGGLIVRTTQNTKLQKLAEESLQYGLQRFEKYNSNYRGAKANIGTEFEKIDTFIPPNNLFEVAVIKEILDDKIIVKIKNHDNDEEIPFSNFSWILYKQIQKILKTGTILSLEKNKNKNFTFKKLFSESQQTIVNIANYDFIKTIKTKNNETIGAVTNITPNKVSIYLKNNQRITISIQSFASLFSNLVKEKLNVGDVIYLVNTKSGYKLTQEPEVQGAILVMDPSNGNILALHGGFDFSTSEFDRSLQAKPQIGSLIKPFIYIAALKNGMCPATKINARPVAIELNKLGLWEPKNDSRSSFEDVTMRQALERSINTATVRVARYAGLKNIKDIISKFGILDYEPENISFILGACNSTLLNIAKAYSIIANGGKKIEPNLIDLVQDKYGNVIFKNSYNICSGCISLSSDSPKPPVIINNNTQVVDPAIIYQIQTMLEGVIKRGSGRRAKNIQYSIAGKTGTSNDNKVVWFAGFTPDIVVVVFVGYDNGKTLGNNASGSTTALPIFIDFINKYIKDKTPRPFPVPSNIIIKNIKNDKEEYEQEVFKEGDEIDFLPEPDDKNFKELDLEFDYVIRKFKSLYN